MAIKTDYDDLKKIQNCLTSNKDDKFTESLNDFLKEKKDDYYYSGKESVDAINLEISIAQLERIISYVEKRQYPSIYKSLKSVYLYAIRSFQKSIFLYGRIRNVSTLPKHLGIVEILDYHETKRIYDYLNIASLKNDTTLPKIKRILDYMIDSNHPVCKIIAEEKL